MPNAHERLIQVESKFCLLSGTGPVAVVTTCEAAWRPVPPRPAVPAHLREGEVEGLVAALMLQAGQPDGRLARLLQHTSVLLVRHVQRIVTAQDRARLLLGVQRQLTGRRYKLIMNSFIVTYMHAQ